MCKVDTRIPAVIKIPLTRGTGANRRVVAHAIVDDADAHLAEMKWRLVYRGRDGSLQYAVRAGGGKTVYLHRVIAGAGPDAHVDHRDGDGLNCRRSNLRAGTRQANNRNRLGGNVNSSIPVPGVGWHAGRRRYRVFVGCKYVMNSRCLRTAVLARVEAEIKYWGGVGCWYSPGLEDRLAVCQT